MTKEHHEKREELIKKLLDSYWRDESILGVIQIGSSVKGYSDVYSDVDFVVVTTKDKYTMLAKNFQKFVHTEKYDLTFTMIDKLQSIMKAENDEDHWSYQDSTVLLDKTNTLKDIIREITAYDKDSRLERLKRYYLGYWENTLNSMSCIDHKNDLGGRIYAALAIRELLRLLFNFNYRWAPKLKWAFKEIKLLQRKPVNLEPQLESILEKPNSEKLSRLWNQIAEFLREEKYTWVDRPKEIL